MGEFDPGGQTDLGRGSRIRRPWSQARAAAAGKRLAVGQAQQRRAAARWRDGEVELGCSNRDEDGTKMTASGPRTQQHLPGAARQRGAADDGEARRLDSGEAEPAARSTTARADGAKTSLTLRRRRGDDG
jgi:hypothetical protein